MFDLDKWQEIFLSLNRHKLRTILTAFGVFWGIFMLVLLLGAGNGLFNSIKYEFADEAINSIWLNPRRTTMPYEGLKKGRQIKFDNSDYDFIQEQFEGIDEITGRFFLAGDKRVTYKDKSLSFSVQCIHPAFKKIENLGLLEGRFITDQDLKEYRKVCVIGQKARESLFGEDTALGEMINIDNVVYKVVGVFTDSSDWILKNIYIPISTAQKVYSGQDRLHRLMFTTQGNDVAEITRVEEQVLAAFAKRKKFDPADKRAIWSSNNAKNYEEFAAMMTAIKGIIWLVGVFTIIAGVIGVSNIMLIIVKDRTKEIGIRKSLGATPWSIVSMILQESIFITALAGYGGMAFGVFLISLAKNVKTDFWRTPHVDLSVVLTATIVLVISGAIAGLIPALKAARVNPVVAMKSD